MSTTINDVLSSMGVNQGSSTSSTSQIEDVQNRFLSMLVAQMKNQDPLNPLDNAQVTSQMAQLSTVQGIEKMYSALESLASSLGSSQASQAAGLIGHVVLAPGNGISPDDSGNVVGYELPYGVDSLTATIHDASGNTVRTLELGARDGGIGMTTWDGLDDNGNAVDANGRYTFSLTGVQGGSEVDTTTLALGQVMSVNVDGGSVELDLGTGGTTTYGGVRRIY